MTDEIVRLRIGNTGATEAQIARLERLDRVVASPSIRPVCVDSLLTDVAVSLDPSLSYCPTCIVLLQVPGPKNFFCTCKTGGYRV